MVDWLAMEPRPDQSFVDYPRPALRLHVPMWVRITIWGSPSRAWVRGFGWFSAGSALLCSILALALAAITKLALIFVVAAVLLALCGVPYFAAVRWIDRHSGWDAVRPPKAPHR